MSHLSTRAKQVLKQIQKGRVLRNSEGSSYYFEDNAERVNEGVVNQLLAHDCTLNYYGGVHYVMALKKETN